MSQTFQQYHDAYYERHFNDDDNEVKKNQTIALKSFIFVILFSKKMDEKISNEFEMEILKQCYESLEKTLDATEKEKEQYQVSDFLCFKTKIRQLQIRIHI
jgi:hypothetical protein